MTITAARLRDPNLKRWSARCTINGVTTPLAGDLPTRTLSLLRSRSTCAVTLRDLPPSTGGELATVDLILDGATLRFFTGLTDQRSAGSARMERKANLLDRLNFDRTVGETITWDNYSFLTAAFDLLELIGISAADVESADAPPIDTYMLGEVYPIVIEPQENLGQVWAELMKYAGTAALITPSGRVRIANNTGIPNESSATVYARGPVSGEFGITDAGYSIEGNEGLTAIYTATGPKRPDGAIPDGTFEATGIIGKSETENYRFLQSDATAEAIAEREVIRRVRDLVNVWFDAPLNPNLWPGDTVLFRDAAIGISATIPAYVTEVATTGDAGMRVQLSIGASLIDGYGSSIRAPLVDFTYTIETEPVVISGSPVTAYLVQCRDESRDPNGRELTERAWTASEASSTVEPETGDTAEIVFLFTSLADAEITLSVTNDADEAASLTKVPVLDQVETFTRVVSVACGSDGWKVLTASGWNTFTRAGVSCTAVPSFNESGPLLSGWSDGAVYTTSDNLATDATEVVAFDDSIGAVFVNEGNVNEILVGHGELLSRSQDGGATWVEIGDGDFGTVRDCQSSPVMPSEIRVCAGDSLWITYDGGANWSAVLTEDDATANALATAPWGRAAVFSASGLDEADAVQFEEGYAVDWSATTPPADGLTSITPLLTEEGFIVGQTADLIRDGLLANLTFTAGSGLLWRLDWNGTQFNAANLVDVEHTDAGKLLNGTADYPLDEETTAVSIGYGAAGTRRDIEILLLPWGASGAQDRIWRYDATAKAWTGITPPQAGWYWGGIAANPFNRNEWVLAGNNANDVWRYDTLGGPIKPATGTEAVLYHTFDRGVTWSPVTLTGGTANPAGSGAWTNGAPYLTWRSDARWAISGGYTGSGVAVGRLWVGSGTTVTQAVTTTDHVPTFLTASTAGRLCYIQVGPFTGSFNAWYGLATSDLTLSAPGGTTPLLNLVEALPGGAGVVALRTEGQLWYAGSNLSAAPSLLGFTDGRHGAIAAATHGVYGVVAVGSPPGILRITNILSTPVTSTVGDASSLYRAIRADRATQTLVGALSGTTSLLITYSRNGTEWTTLAGPSGMTSSNTAAWLEVIDAEAL